MKKDTSGGLGKLLVLIIMNKHFSHFWKSVPFIVKFNLLFVLVFLNIWDFVISREFLNASVLGIIMFTPATILWLIDSFKAAMLGTLYSLFLATVLAVFFVEGYYGGAGWFVKISFWLPYLAAAVVNAVWGLRIYGKHKRKSVNRV